jgi:hypothetical protein
MIALHPPLSGMPLAFVALLGCVELLRIRAPLREPLKITRAVLIVAVVASTVAVFLSGYQASSPLGDLSPEIQAALGTHHALGRLLLINALLLGTFAWLESRATHGKRVLFSLYSFALLVQLGLTLSVGYLGGGLVFTHRLGVSVPM